MVTQLEHRSLSPLTGYNDNGTLEALATFDTPHSKVGIHKLAHKEVFSKRFPLLKEGALPLGHFHCKPSMVAF